MHRGWLLLPLALAATTTGHATPLNDRPPSPHQPEADWATALAEGRRHLALERPALRRLLLGDEPERYRSKNWEAAAAALPALDRAQAALEKAPSSARQRFLTALFRGLALEHSGRDLEALRSLREGLDRYANALDEHTVPPPTLATSAGVFALEEAASAPGFDELVALAVLLGSPASQRSLDLRLAAHQALAAGAERVLGSAHPFLVLCLRQVLLLQAEADHPAGWMATAHKLFEILEADDARFLAERLQVRAELSGELAQAGRDRLRREFLVEEVERARERFGATSLAATLATQQAVEELGADAPLEGDLGERLSRARLKRRLRPRHLPTWGAIPAPLEAALRAGLARTSWLWDRALVATLTRLLGGGHPLATDAAADLGVVGEDLRDRGLLAEATVVARARLDMLDGLRLLAGRGALRPDPELYAALVFYRRLLVDLGHDATALAVGARVRDLELFLEVPEPAVHAPGDRVSGSPEPSPSAASPAPSSDADAAASAASGSLPPPKRLAK